jgi:hypothetical protein
LKVNQSTGKIGCIDFKWSESFITSFSWWELYFSLLQDCRFQLICGRVGWQQKVHSTRVGERCTYLISLLKDIPQESKVTIQFRSDANTACKNTLFPSLSEGNSNVTDHISYYHVLFILQVN